MMWFCSFCSRECNDNYERPDGKGRCDECRDWARQQGDREAELRFWIKIDKVLVNALQAWEIQQQRMGGWK